MWIEQGSSQEFHLESGVQYGNGGGQTSEDVEFFSEFLFWIGAF